MPCIIAALKRLPAGIYVRPQNREIILGLDIEDEPHIWRSQGDIIDMGAPAPSNAVSFSHELNCWLTSWQGLWVVSTADSARKAFDSGCFVLDV